MLRLVDKPGTREEGDDGRNPTLPVSRSNAQRHGRHEALPQARFRRVPPRGQLHDRPESVITMLRNTHLSRLLGIRRGCQGFRALARRPPVHRPALVLLMARFSASSTSSGAGDHGQDGHVHLLRQLLHLLRNGHRRPRLRDGQLGREARRLRRLRHVRPRLPAGGPEARGQDRPVQGRNADPRLRGGPVTEGGAGL